MALYLISYDLNDPGKRYAGVREAIMAYGTHCKVGTTSTWLVRTADTATQVRDKVRAKMDQNDEILVVEVGSTGAWWNLSNEVGIWLKAQIEAVRV